MSQLLTNNKARISNTNGGRIITLSNRRLYAFLLLLAAVLVTLAVTHAKASVSSDLDLDDLDNEYNSGIDALYKNEKKNSDENGSKKTGKGTAVSEVDDDDDEDNEQVDEIDYTDKDDDDDDNGNSKKADKKQQKKSAKKDDGVLPQLAEQADKLNEQSQQLADAAEFFKSEAAAISGLPKKLTETSARLAKLAKLPAWKSNAMMFSTQSKKMKEQSRRIQDLITQLHDRIPDYAKESDKLLKQSESIKEVADQNLLQGLDSDDASVVELRTEVKTLQKDYAKMLKKSNELRKNLKQLREQGDAVNKLADGLPEDGDVTKLNKPESAEL